MNPFLPSTPLSDQDVVAVLARAPSAGGKTRLFRELGRQPDPEFLAALLLDTLDAVATPGVVRVVCFAPAEAEREMRALVPPEVLLLAQRGDDLGDRMRFAFEDILGYGAASVVLVGSDVPGLDQSAVSDAHRFLHERPDAVVLGPTTDGGYYLVGATWTPMLLFANMEWSRPGVLEETERRARAAAVHVFRVGSSRDIDTVDDLRALIVGSASAVRTREKCEALSLRHR